MTKLLALYLPPAILINLGNLFAYLFQIVLARAMPPDQVGAFNALFSLANIVSAPASVVPFVLARAIIDASRGSAGLERSIIERSALVWIAFCVAIVLVGVIALDPLRAWLKIERYETGLLALFMLATILAFPLAIGWLQGHGRYVAAGTALGGVPTLRFFFGIVLVAMLGGGVDAALVSTALPGLIVLIAAALPLRPIMSSPRLSVPSEVWRDMARFAVPAMASFLLLFAFWNLDVVLVRWLFSADDSGYYAIAAVLARIPLLLPIAFVNVLFPEVARANLSVEDGALTGKRALWVTLWLSAGLGLGTALGLALFAEPLLVFLAGPAYAVAAPLLRVLSFAMAGLALVQIIVTYAMAKNYHLVFLPLVAALAVFVVVSSRYAADPLWVAHCLAWTMLTLLALFVAIVLTVNFERQAARDKP